jgi:hypothetical protein
LLNLCIWVAINLIIIIYNIMTTTFDINADETIRGTKTVDGASTLTGDVTVGGILKQTNGEGGYVNGYNCVSKLIDFTPSSTTIDSGAVYVPANSVITRLTAVVTVALVTAGASTDGTSFGTSVGGTQFTGSLNVDSLAGGGTGVVLGRGNSTDTVLNTALNGASTIGFTAGTPYKAAATEVHGRVTSTPSGAGAQPYTAGQVNFFVEFIYLGGN